MNWAIGEQIQADGVRLPAPGHPGPMKETHTIALFKAVWMEHFGPSLKQTPPNAGAGHY